jgi:zinc protease
VFMNRFMVGRIAVFCAVAIWAVRSPGDDRALRGDPVFPFPARSDSLPNGLSVISIPFDSPGIVAYYTVVKTGSRNEVEPGLSGFAHFFEHMMFRGTKKYPQEKYNDILKGLGADSNAFTTDDYTCYHMTIPATALATAVELEADRFRNLEYDKPDFQKESRAVLGEYNKGASSPFLILEETLHALAYKTHTYRHTTIGFLADVKDMPNQFDYSKTFFDRWYRPENCAIVVVGDVDHNRLLKLVREHYGTWERGKAGVTIPVEPPQDRERVSELKWPSETLPVLLTGYHIPNANHADSAALAALAQALFGETSPLYKKLVLSERKVAMMFAEPERKRDPGLFLTLVRARKPEFVAEVRDEIFHALAQAALEPIARNRLAAIQSHARYEFAGTLVGPDSIARAACESIAIAGSIEAINEYYDRYARVTPADLVRVASTYFKPENRTVVTLVAEKKP